MGSPVALWLRAGIGALRNPTVLRVARQRSQRLLDAAVLYSRFCAGVESAPGLSGFRHTWKDKRPAITCRPSKYDSIT